MSNPSFLYSESRFLIVRTEMPRAAALRVRLPSMICSVAMISDRSISLIFIVLLWVSDITATRSGLSRSHCRCPLSGGNRLLGAFPAKQARDLDCLVPLDFCCKTDEG